MARRKGRRGLLRAALSDKMQHVFARSKVDPPRSFCHVRIVALLLSLHVVRKVDATGGSTREEMWWSWVGVGHGRKARGWK